MKLLFLNYYQRLCSAWPRINLFFWSISGLSK